MAETHKNWFTKTPQTVHRIRYVRLRYTNTHVKSRINDHRPGKPELASCPFDSQRLAACELTGVGQTVPFAKFSTPICVLQFRTSAVLIVVFHFESNRIVSLLFEISNRIE